MKLQYATELSSTKVRSPLYSQHIPLPIEEWKGKDHTLLTLNNKTPSSLLFQPSNKNLPCLQVFKIFTFSKNPNRKRHNHRLQINQTRCSWTPNTEDKGNSLPANSPCWNIFLRYQSLTRFICKSVVTCLYSGFSNQHKHTTKSGAFIRTRDLQKAGKVKDLVGKKRQKNISERFLDVYIPLKWLLYQYETQRAK